MIKKCTCSNEYQDKRYGKGKRVHNQAVDINKTIKWRCTVCTKEKGINYDMSKL